VRWGRADYVVIHACAEQFAVRGLNGVPITVETMIALTGLLIEISFIATFTQRFFGSK
jgi:hypothetical protein